MYAGKSVKRVDAFDKVTGRAKYTDDLCYKDAYVARVIDAISLYLIQKINGMDTLHAVYISIGGVANDTTINRISRGIRTILAVDNDPAGEFCRNRHSDLEALIPAHKDWNEDLQKA